VGETGNVIGIAVDYAQLRQLVAARRKELGLRQLEVDEMAGVQSGYTGKLECGDRHFGDMSLGAILGALGMSLVGMRSTTPHENLSDAARASMSRLKKNREAWGAKGGRAYLANSTFEERRAAARKAARARWSNWRAIKAEKERKAKRQKAATRDNPRST
jgi:transcriptional regulator with XRE-family HTH domain